MDNNHDSEFRANFDEFDDFFDLPNLQQDDLVTSMATMPSQSLLNPQVSAPGYRGQGLQTQQGCQPQERSGFGYLDRSSVQGLTHYTVNAHHIPTQNQTYFPYSANVSSGQLPAFTPQNTNQFLHQAPVYPQYNISLSSKLPMSVPHYANQSRQRNPVYSPYNTHQSSGQASTNAFSTDHISPWGQIHSPHGTHGNARKLSGLPLLDTNQTPRQSPLYLSDNRSQVPPSNQPVQITQGSRVQNSSIQITYNTIPQVPGHSLPPAASAPLTNVRSRASQHVSPRSSRRRPLTRPVPLHKRRGFQGNIEIPCVASQSVKLVPITAPISVPEPTLQIVQQREKEIIEIFDDDKSNEQPVVGTTPDQVSKPIKQSKPKKELKWLKTTSSYALQSAMDPKVLPRNLVAQGKHEELEERQKASNKALALMRQAESKAKTKEKEKKRTPPTTPPAKVMSEKSRKRRDIEETFGQKDAPIAKKARGTREDDQVDWVEPLTSTLVQSATSQGPVAVSLRAATTSHVELELPTPRGTPVSASPVEEYAEGEQVDMESILEHLWDDENEKPENAALMAELFEDSDEEVCFSPLVIDYGEPFEPQQELEVESEACEEQLEEESGTLDTLRVIESDSEMSEEE